MLCLLRGGFCPPPPSAKGIGAIGWHQCQLGLSDPRWQLLGTYRGGGSFMRQLFTSTHRCKCTRVCTRTTSWRGRGVRQLTLHCGTESLEHKSCASPPGGLQDTCPVCVGSQGPKWGDFRHKRKGSCAWPTGGGLRGDGPKAQGLVLPLCLFNDRSLLPSDITRGVCLMCI